MRCAAIS